LIAVLVLFVLMLGVLMPVVQIVESQGVAMGFMPVMVVEENCLSGDRACQKNGNQGACDQRTPKTCSASKQNVPIPLPHGNILAAQTGSPNFQNQYTDADSVTQVTRESLACRKPRKNKEL